jgi:hypothetical protein
MYGNVTKNEKQNKETLKNRILRLFLPLRKNKPLNKAARKIKFVLVKIPSATIAPRTK